MIVWLYDCMIVWLYDCIIVRLYDCIIVWLYDCMIVCLYNCMIVWLYDCMIAWLYNCIIVWVYDCMMFSMDLKQKFIKLFYEGTLHPVTLFMRCFALTSWNDLYTTLGSNLFKETREQYENFRFVDIQISVWSPLFLNLQIIIILIH